MGSLTAPEFYRATNPLRTLNIKEPEDAKKYIDFASVRGGQVIEDLKVDILWAEPGYFTCIVITNKKHME